MQNPEAFKLPYFHGRISPFRSYYFHMLSEKERLRAALQVATLTIKEMKSGQTKGATGTLLILSRVLKFTEGEEDSEKTESIDRLISQIPRLIRWRMQQNILN